LEDANCQSVPAKKVLAKKFYAMRRLCTSRMMPIVREPNCSESELRKGVKV
jgi:hypothetical protein